MIKHRRMAVAACLLVLLAPGARRALAHDGDSGPNGGPIVEVKGLHLELVAKERDLAVVLSDTNHAPLPSDGASGRAVILEGSAQLTVPLAAMKPDRLAAKLEKPLATGARVVISAKLATGQDLLARFVVK